METHNGKCPYRAPAAVPAAPAPQVLGVSKGIVGQVGPVFVPGPGSLLPPPEFCPRQTGLPCPFPSFPHPCPLSLCSICTKTESSTAT